MVSSLGYSSFLKEYTTFYEIVRKQDRFEIGIIMSYELNGILEKIQGNFICVYEGESKVFSSKEEFEKSDMEKNCTVSSISTLDGTIVLELKKWVCNTPDVNNEWAKEHEKQFGEEPSFF